jgi:hypothetical protein
MTDRRTIFEQEMGILYFNIQLYRDDNTRLLELNKEICILIEQNNDVLSIRDLENKVSMFQRLKQSIKDLEYIQGVSRRDRFKLVKNAFELKHTIERIESNHLSFLLK